MKKPSFIKLIQCLILCLLTFAIVPERIFAQEAVACMKDDNGNITEYYYNVVDAMNGSRKGAIHMLTDWDIGAQINIVEGTTSIIYMDGHVIKKSNGKQSGNCEGGIFTIHPNAKLYLYGSTDKKELIDSKGNKVSTGGLVTGGYATHGGAIYMKKAAKLYLTNVTISGNTSEYKGGGIFIAFEDAEIWMDNGHIDHNWAGTSGGGIYSDADGTHIHMKNSSTINYNQGNKTGSCGGGICFNYSWFSIEGDDNSDNEISHNKVVMGDYGDGTSGGGIHIASKKLATNYGLIRNLTIKDNFAGYGGGIDDCGKNIYLQDVTITGNESKIRGGGVAVMYEVDLYVRGNVQIHGNHRTDGANDDIFLQTGFGQAYVRASGLSSASLIGIRTEESGDTLVAKNISDNSLISCFFLNETSDFHIGFEPNDNELWQRTGVTTYAVKVNGQPAGKYVEGTSNVTVVDNNTDPNQIFVSWEKMNDVIKNITDEQWTEKTLTFTMPAQEVKLTAEYKAAATDLSLNISSITKDETLPATGTFKWIFDGKEVSEEVDLKWYKKQDDTYVSCSENETASYGTDYVFELCAKAEQNDVQVSYGTVNGVHVLSSKVSLTDITVNCDGVELAELSLNDEGALTLKSKDIIVGKDVIKYIDPIVVSVREGASRSEVAYAINTATETTATSNNGNRYSVVAANAFGVGDLNNDWFSSTEESGTIVIPSNSNSEKPSYYIYEATKTITSYDSNKIDLNNNSVKLIVVVLSDNGGVDTKPSTPELQEGKTEKQGDVLYQQIITNYDNVSTPNAKVFLMYNNDGDNNWTIKQMFYTNDVTASDDQYKMFDAIAWVIDENNNMSGISDPKTYVLNSKKKSFTSSISKVDVTMDSLVYGQSLPKTIKNIDITLFGVKTLSYTDTPILSWSPVDPDGVDTKVENNKAYQAKVELTNTEGYSIEYLSSLHVIVNENPGIYAYIEEENDKAFLYITFPELEGSTGGYDDDAQLSYILSSIEVGDYVKEISYDEAVALNNDFEYFYLPNVVLKVGNNEKDSIYADVTYNAVTAFDANNHNDQEIVLEGTIKKPSYINFNGLSDKITLKIKVKGTGSNQGSLTCEEYMKSNDWTWSETKQKCVYRVSNTSVQ